MKKLKEEYQHWGLRINFDKTKYICIDENASDIPLDFEFEIIIKKCDTFKYLDSIINVSSTCDSGVETRIATGALHGLLQRCLQLTRIDRIRTEEIWA
ncbi:hypothetical protein C0J52_17699 [Blattella germanica]|nr:hypothetical protein C0J52_17699 [Blattella germanica]